MGPDFHSIPETYVSGKNSSKIDTVARSWFNYRNFKRLTPFQRRSLQGGPVREFLIILPQEFWARFNKLPLKIRSQTYFTPDKLASFLQHMSNVEIFLVDRIYYSPLFATGFIPDIRKTLNRLDFPTIFNMPYEAGIISQHLPRLIERSVLDKIPIMLTLPDWNIPQVELAQQRADVVTITFSHSWGYVHIDGRRLPPPHWRTLVLLVGYHREQRHFSVASPDYFVEHTTEGNFLFQGSKPLDQLCPLTGTRILPKTPTSMMAAQNSIHPWRPCRPCYKPKGRTANHAQRKKLDLEIDLCESKVNVQDTMRKAIVIDIPSQALPQLKDIRDLSVFETGFPLTDKRSYTRLHPILKEFWGLTKIHPLPQEISIHTWKQQVQNLYQVDKVDSFRLLETIPAPPCTQCGATTHRLEQCLQRIIFPEDAFNTHPFFLDMLQFVTRTFNRPRIPREFRGVVHGGFTQEIVQDLENWLEHQISIFWQQFFDITRWTENLFLQLKTYSLWRIHIAGWVVLGVDMATISHIIDGVGPNLILDLAPIHFQEYDLSPKHLKARNLKVQKGIERGILIPIPKEFCHFILPTFIVEDASGSRLITDPTGINYLKTTDKFSQVVLRGHEAGLRGKLAFSIDESKAFHQVPSRPDAVQRQCIRFIDEKDKVRHASFTGNWFGGADFPYIHNHFATKRHIAINKLAPFGRHSKVRYADDIMNMVALLSQNIEPAQMDANAKFVHLMHRTMGVRLNAKGDEKFTSEPTFIGRLYNLILQKSFPKMEKTSQFLDMVRDQVNKQTVTLREIARLRGKFDNITEGKARHLCYQLNQIARKLTGLADPWADISKKYEVAIPFDDNLVYMLMAWVRFLGTVTYSWETKDSPFQLLVCSDAGPQLGAYFCTATKGCAERKLVQPKLMKVFPIPHELQRHREGEVIVNSYIAELFTLVLAAITEMSHRPAQTEYTMVLQTDNEAVFYAILKRTAQLPFAQTLLAQLFTKATQYRVKIIATWGRRSLPLGTIADLGTRFVSPQPTADGWVYLLKAFPQCPHKLDFPLQTDFFLNLDMFWKGPAALINPKTPYLITMPCVLDSGSRKLWWEWVLRSKFYGLLITNRNVRLTPVKHLIERKIDLPGKFLTPWPRGVAKCLWFFKHD